MSSILTDSRFVGARKVVRRVSAGMLAILLLIATAMPTLSSTPADSAAGTANAQSNIDDELVYLDKQGYIRVLDPFPAPGMPELTWQSPSKGWEYIALGDFNADGDMEIVAVTSKGGNWMEIFDPVAEGVSSDQADGYFDRVPWQRLYRGELPGKPLYVAAGNLHPETPADDIAYYYDSGDDSDPETRYRFITQVTPGSDPDGRQWKPQIYWPNVRSIDWMAVGNLDDTEIDEVVFLTQESGFLEVRRVKDNSLERILSHQNAGMPWLAGAIGEFICGGGNGLAVSRTARDRWDSMFVLYRQGPEWVDAFREFFAPAATSVFMGDLGGNGDDELIALRSVPADDPTPNKPRLFFRDNGNDVIGFEEQVLNPDNGFKTGVAGDVDGDGRDEIAILRQNLVRIFYQPDIDSASTAYEVSADTRMLLAGNLDANGLVSSSRFTTDVSIASTTLIAGTTAEPIPVEVMNAGNKLRLPYVYSTAGDSSWVRLSRSAVQTPSTINVLFDATSVSSGTYTDTLLITTDDLSVVNSPYTVDLRLKVEDGVALSPKSAIVIDNDCANGGVQQKRTFKILGTEGVGFTVGTSSNVNWAAIDPSAGAVPADATITFDGGLLGDGVDSTEVFVKATINGQEKSDSALITLLCAESTIQLPLVLR